MENIVLQENFIPDGIEITTQLITNNNTPLHKHSTFEILYIVDGSLEQVLNGKKQNLTIGDCFFLAPNDVHSLKSSPNSRHRDILVNPFILKQVLALISLTPETFGIMLAQNKYMRFNTTELLELERNAQHFSDNSDIYIKRCLGITLLLQILNKLFESSNPNAKEAPSLVKQILNYLNRNMFVSGGISAIANELKYSPSYVSHCFKKYTGTTLTDYIKNLRLNYIAYYLKTSDYSLQKIADSVGIESLSYMNKIFKERYGMTPMQYKKSNTPPRKTNGETPKK